MRGNLQDEQAAMRARQHSRKPKPKPKKVKFREPTEEEERLFFVEDLERELQGLKPKRRPKRIRIVPIPTEEKLPAKRVKAHGNRWSAFGTVNADSASPVHASIRNWGLKIKTREDEDQPCANPRPSGSR
jgi:hypothetical protein